MAEKEVPAPSNADPPPPGFHPSPQDPPPRSEPVVVHSPVKVATIAVVGPDPMPLICPHCHDNIVSTVETEANTKTHLSALLLCLCGCWPCICVPYCMDSCQSKNHTCPNCKAYLGVYSN